MLGGGKSERRITLAEVASLAQVSSTTASLVLNNREAGIPAVTKDRVTAAAAELGYRANASARALRRRRTESIALITDAIATTPYAGEIILGAQEYAWSHEHLLYIVDSNGSEEVELAAVEAMLDRQIEGLLFAAMHTRRIALPAPASAVPTVLINCFLDPDEATAVEVLPNDRAGEDTATSLLINAGHTRIALINGDTGTYAWIERRRGFLDALHRHGLQPDETLIREGNWLPDGAYQLTMQLFAEPDPPTALVCANDRSAYGAYDALRSLGLRIPKDVSVVGYDDQEISRFARPALTTMALPHYELGRRGCELLFSGQRMSPTRELIDCPSRIRDSVAPPSITASAASTRNT